MDNKNLQTGYRKIYDPKNIDRNKEARPKIQLFSKLVMLKTTKSEITIPKT